ncbi:hypothetical protein [Pseudobdellovibrio exovorus]|uniref:Uncharacterized protein n=1 Tax=Pseudobdellovibrio exovorus JSS TaxID=1184267 RepID=M4VTS5_9BACT|nr:hypothetical protein [Pseudobdellovibrio exovorus]AGH96604.1 hypothetical protein A11Q_2388 [Pseudobdellovibrio exovorus JSS]
MRKAFSKKLLLAFLLSPILLGSILLSPLTSHAGHMVSCGGFLDNPNTERQFLFDFYQGATREAQSISISVGKPHQFVGTIVQVRQTKVSTGFLAHKEILSDAEGKFRLEWSAGLRSTDSTWKLTAKFPELGLVMDQQNIDCVGYY